MSRFRNISRRFGLIVITGLLGTAFASAQTATQVPRTAPIASATAQMHRTIDPTLLDLVTVDVTITGYGSVTSGKKTCASTKAKPLVKCTLMLPRDKLSLIEQKPADNYMFDRWTNCPLYPTTPTCPLTPAANQTLNVAFAPFTERLDVWAAGPKGSTLTIDAPGAGLSCGPAPANQPSGPDLLGVQKFFATLAAATGGPPTVVYCWAKVVRGTDVRVSGSVTVGGNTRQITAASFGEDCTGHVVEAGCNLVMDKPRKVTVNTP